MEFNFKVKLVVSIEMSWIVYIQGIFCFTGELACNLFKKKSDNQFI